MTSIINYITELYYEYQGERDLCIYCHTYACEDAYCGKYINCSYKEKQLRIKAEEINTKLDFYEKDKNERLNLLFDLAKIEWKLKKYEKDNNL